MVELTEVQEIKVIGKLLDEHTEQDERSFLAIKEDFRHVNGKLDHLLVEITRISTLQDVAKEAGSNAGKKTAQIWSAVIAVLVVALDKIMEKLF